ncbi:hypothetical protein UMZ34_17845 [Halopseudomonas pachastrellae]|nr:hypothetical protein UMZ34_17845 [Halopseudomonas pachastrellae]
MLEGAAVESALGSSLVLYPGFAADAELPFSELYFAYLNTPMTGRNLLGADAFDNLQSQLLPGEQAILVVSRGQYPHVPEDFIPPPRPAASTCCSTARRSSCTTWTSTTGCWCRADLARW